MAYNPFTKSGGTLGKVGKMLSGIDPNILGPYLDTVLKARANAGTSAQPPPTASTLASPASPASGYETAATMADRIFGAPSPAVDAYAGMSPAMAMAARSRASGFRGTGPQKKQVAATGGAAGDNSFNDARRKLFLAKVAPELEQERMRGEAGVAKAGLTGEYGVERTRLTTEQKALDRQEKTWQFNDKMAAVLPTMTAQNQLDMQRDAARFDAETNDIILQHRQALDMAEKEGKIVGTAQRNQYLAESLGNSIELAQAQGNIELAGQLALKQYEITAKTRAEETGKASDIPSPAAVGVAPEQKKVGDLNGDGIVDAADEELQGIANLQLAGTWPDGTPISPEDQAKIKIRIQQLKTAKGAAPRPKV